MKAKNSKALVRGSNGKSYWRSLERLQGSPALQQLNVPGGEFPAGASEAPEGVSRRTMLSIMGASFAMAGLEGCRRPVETILPYVSAPENVIPGIPRYYASTFPLGTSAYGVVVESHEGRPTKIDGNALHPSSQGGANAWMQASVLDLYDPDRSFSPRHGKAAEGEDGEAHDQEDHGAASHGEGEASEGDAASTWDDFVSYWGGRATALEADGGAGLAVIASAHCSPTLNRMAASVAARYPASRWVVHEPAGDENIFRGLAMATGSPVRPAHHLKRAKVVLALDADLLGLESESVAATKGFAAARRVESPGDAMSRLYVVESHLSLTGANADHRLRLRRDEIPGFTLALAGALGVAGASGGSLPAAAQGKLGVIADDLRAAGSAALVVAGRAQAVEVHALVHAINQALGAVGTTVTLHDAEDVAHADRQALGQLVSDMKAGEISDLLILGGNPAYDTPADLGFADALSSVEHSVHLSLYEDETSRLCSWHLPAAHYLEAWGDARGADGGVSVVQPLIAPLFGGKSAIEIAGLLATDELQPGHGLVRATWSALGMDEAAWRRTLHDGLFAASATAPISASVSDASELASKVAALGGGDGLELTAHLSASVHDGRYANNGWLQELPDPISKITWDNALFLSPATAGELGVETGDLLRISRGEATLEAPAFVLPGQADGSLAIELGFGREHAGRVGNGVGANAYALLTQAAPFGASGFSVEKIRGSRELVQTQEHWDMEDRPIVRESTAAEYPANPEFAASQEFPHDAQMFADHDYSEGPQWGMAIDLTACTGCNACVVACQSENNIPIVGREQISRGREMHWLRIDRYFSGDEGDPETVFQPVPCMHCENAPCEQVCPVAATVHDRNGINAMIYNRCIGTRYCSNNCPYKVRRFNFFNYTKDTPELTKMAMNPDVTVRSRGVMEKCTYCVQRINEAQIVSKRSGEALTDGKVKAACQQTCPADAIAFGDILDPDSAVARAKAQPRNYVMLEELNNRPRTSYLGKLRNPNPAWAGA